MIGVRFTPAAEAEVVAAAEWYDSKRAGIGGRLVAAIDAAMQRIATAPLGYPLWIEDAPYRRCVLRRFPYVIFFTYDNQTVTVVAVAHRRRRPGYWQKTQR